MASRSWKQYRPGKPSAPDGPPASPPTHETYKPPKLPKPVRSLEERTVKVTSGSRTKMVVLGVAAASLGGGLIFALAGGADDPQTDEPQTDTGFSALLAALDEERGSTVVRRAVIYPTYASITAPYKEDVASDERELSYYWNGELSESGKGTSDTENFDLATVDASVLDGLCPQVEALVEDSEMCYLVIEKPSADDETPSWIWAYASNEFNQAARIEFGLDGTVVETHPAS